MYAQGVRTEGWDPHHGYPGRRSKRLSEDYPITELFTGTAIHASLTMTAELCYGRKCASEGYRVRCKDVGRPLGNPNVTRER